MNEPFDDALLVAWLDGDLDPAEMAEVDAAVTADPAVAARADRLASLLGRLADAGTEGPPPGFAETLSAGLSAALQQAPDLPSAASPAPAARAPDRPRPTRPWAAGTGRAPRHRARLQRVTGALAVLLLVLTGGVVGLRTYLDGGPFESGGEAPASTTPDTAEEVTADVTAPVAPPTASADDLQATIDPQPSATPSASAADDPPAVAARPPASDGSGNGAGAGGTGSPPGPAGPDEAAGPDEDADLGADLGGDDGGTGGQGGQGTPGPTSPSPAPTEPSAPTPPAPTSPAPSTEPDGDGTTSPSSPPSSPAPGDGASDPDPAPGGAPLEDEQEAPPAPESDQPDTGGDAAAGPPPSSPTIADTQVALPDDDAVRAHFGGREETRQLLGLPEDEAAEREVTHAEQVEAAGPFADGSSPGQCLAGTDLGAGPDVVAAVESAVDADGNPLLAHLVVSGTPELSRATVVLATPDGCATRTVAVAT